MKSLNSWFLLDNNNWLIDTWGLFTSNSMQIQHAWTPRWANWLLLNDHFQLWILAKWTLAFLCASNSLLPITAEWQVFSSSDGDLHRCKQNKWQITPWDAKCVAQNNDYNCAFIWKGLWEDQERPERCLEGTWVPSRLIIHFTKSLQFKWLHSVSGVIIS